MSFFDFPREIEDTVSRTAAARSTRGRAIRSRRTEDLGQPT
jgi:hypothetical protein